jgi:peptide deformylase
MRLSPILNVQTPHAEFVQDITDHIIEIANALCEFVIENQYMSLAGIAANQLSGDSGLCGESGLGRRLNLSICAIRTSRWTAFAAINPIIDSYSVLSLQSIESCLTWPKMIVRAKRHDEVRVSYIGIDGTKKFRNARGFEAKVWQHEINHLYGINEDVHPLPQKQQQNERCQCGSGAKFKKCCGR